MIQTNILRYIYPTKSEVDKWLEDNNEPVPEEDPKPEPKKESPKPEQSEEKEKPSEKDEPTPEKDDSHFGDTDDSAAGVGLDLLDDLVKEQNENMF